MFSLEPKRGEVLCLVSAIVLLAGTVLTLLFASPTSAQTSTDDAMKYLDRVAGAERQPYRAEQLVVYFGKPESAAVLDVRSTSSGEYVRAESGTSVTRVWRRPDVGVVSGTGSSLRELAPANVPMRPADVLAKYSIEVGKPEKLLGVDVVPLSLSRRDDGVVVERWWVHKESGLVYRRRLYGADGKLVGMTTILEMHWGQPGAVEPFDVGSAQPAVAHTVSSAGVPDRLADEYRLVRAYSLEIDGKSARQWLYSDGLHAMSVFSTHGNMRPPAGFDRVAVGAKRMWSGPGPGTWAWQGAGWSWLVVGEEPGLDAARMTRPFPKGGPSAWARMGSMWSRIGRGIASVFS